MNLCINYYSLSSKKLALNSHEIYKGGNGNILGQIGLPLHEYTNNKGIKIFEPFLKALTDRLTSLQNLYYNSSFFVNKIDYSAIKHPLRDRKRPPNIPEIKTFSYRARELVNSEQSLVQSFFIKDSEINKSGLERLLNDINKEAINKIIKKVPEFNFSNINDMFDYQKILFQPFGNYFSSKIFKNLYDSQQITNDYEINKKWSPVSAGSLHLNFKKPMCCLKTVKRGFLGKKHIFDTQELRRKKLIESKIMWDGALNNCPLCGGEIIGLSPYAEIKHLYLTTNDETITSKRVFEDNELIKGLLNEVSALGDASIQMLNSIYRIELDKRVGFEMILPYIKRVNFNINQDEYLMLVEKPRLIQLVRTRGIVPFIILKQDDEGSEEKIYKSLIERNIKNSKNSGRKDTIELSEQIFKEQEFEIKKINMR